MTEIGAHGSEETRSGVDAAGEAYAFLATPDAPLAHAGTDAENRWRRRPMAGGNSETVVSRGRRLYSIATHAGGRIFQFTVEVPQR